MLFHRTHSGRALSALSLLCALPILGLSSNALANPLLTIQAENAASTTGSGWSTEKQRPGYNGSGYIVWRGKDDFRTSDSQPPAGIKAYDFQVSKAGTYEFVARVQARIGNESAASDKDNDAWIKFTSGSATKGVRGDAAKWTKFFVGGADESWKNYSSGEQYDPTFFTDIQRDLPVGKHRILIGGRSARFAIDSVGLKFIKDVNISAPAAGTPDPVQTPVSTPAGSAGACTAVGANLAIAIREYASNCPTIARKDCDPMSNGSWICSSERINANAGTPTEPSQPVTPPVTPTPPAAPAPALPVAGDACTATGANLAQARQNYTQSCPGIPRKDCDPLSNGKWLCSSTNITGGSVSPTAPPVTPSQPSTPSAPSTPVPGDTCTANGANLALAKQNYAANCPTVPRKDCDPVNGGGWLCSSAVIGSVPPVQSPGPATPPVSPPPPSNNGTVGLVSANDLVSLHYDNCPDPDDGHAIVAGKAVIDATGLSNILVVNGTCGENIRNRYRPDSEAVLQAVWGNNWLDSFNKQTLSVNTAADQWAATLANGDDVWVAEGGPSDFTARVLRRLGEAYPSVNRKRVRVIQHSAGVGFNEQNTLTSNINLVKQVADYRAIPNGNNKNNGSAGLNEKSAYFVNIARQSRYASEWAAAFNYLDPNDRLDFSDTVELLYLINDTQTRDVNDFANRYLR